MVTHDIRVRGTDLLGVTSPKAPVIMQMNDDDFPARFLQDLLTPRNKAISSAKVVAPIPVVPAVPGVANIPPTLYQPVQRMLNVALIDLTCNTPQFPRVDAKRIVSAGLVVRRLVRWSPTPGAPVTDDRHTRAAWMRNARGQWSWVRLAKDEEDLDPDPTRRPALKSGDPVLDGQLAAMMFAKALTESTTPAFAAPPATCAAINRTVLYGLIPTASSEVSDATPLQVPVIKPSDLKDSLPGYLLSAGHPHAGALSGRQVDARWMSDEFLSSVFPPESPPPAKVVRKQAYAAFQQFALALRMLHTVFAAFDPTKTGREVLKILNRRQVTFQPPITLPADPTVSVSTMGMGDFFALAKSVLLDYPPQTPDLTMPTHWQWLHAPDETDLIQALLKAAAQASKTKITPQGRFQDETRLYRLRMFVRLKSDHPNCPPQLVWSKYSEEFFIAPWHATGERAHPPVPLPDPVKLIQQKPKPNCSFQVPGSLMGAMQGTTMSGLTNGSGGGPALKLGWICGFNIPLITICAFFVLNIFLTLLNIVFFWLPIIKICIPIPVPSSTEPDP
jgi:hypothetical protein